MLFGLFFHVPQLLPVRCTQQHSYCISKSTMKHMQEPVRKPDLPFELTTIIESACILVSWSNTQVPQLCSLLSVEQLLIFDDVVQSLWNIRLYDVCSPLWPSPSHIPMKPKGPIKKTKPLKTHPPYPREWRVLSTPTPSWCHVTFISNAHAKTPHYHYYCCYCDQGKGGRCPWGSLPPRQVWASSNPWSHIAKLEKMFPKVPSLFGWGVGTATS